MSKDPGTSRKPSELAIGNTGQCGWSTVCVRGAVKRREERGKLGAHRKRQNSLNISILLQAEERLKPLEPCTKPGLAALHQEGYL